MDIKGDPIGFHRDMNKKTGMMPVFLGGCDFSSAGEASNEPVALEASTAEPIPPANELSR